MTAGTARRSADRPQLPGVLAWVDVPSGGWVRGCIAELETRLPEGGRSMIRFANWIQNSGGEVWPLVEVAFSDDGRATLTADDVQRRLDALWLILAEGGLLDQYLAAQDDALLTPQLRATLLLVNDLQARNVAPCLYADYEDFRQQAIRKLREERRRRVWRMAGIASTAWIGWALAAALALLLHRWLFVLAAVAVGLGAVVYTMVAAGMGRLVRRERYEWREEECQPESMPQDAQIICRFALQLRDIRAFDTRVFVQRLCVTTPHHAPAASGACQLLATRDADDGRAATVLLITWDDRTTGTPKTAA